MFLLEKTPGGIPTGKYRSIDHLSFESPGHPSVNGSIPAHLLVGPIQFTTVNEFTQLIEEVEDDITEMDGHVHTGKVDIARGYCIVPIRKADWNSLAFVDLDNRLHWNTRLPMGLRQGARTFSSLNMAPSWILRHGFGVHNKTYVDDMGIASVSGPKNAEDVEVACMLYWLLGMPVAPDKTEQEKTVMVFLGLQVNTVTKTVGYPPHKMARLRTAIRDWLEKTTATVKELEIMVGLLGDACQLIPQGRLFMRRLYGALRFGSQRQNLSRGGRFVRVVVGAEARKDFLWWDRQLLYFDSPLRGVRPFYNPSRRLLQPSIFETSDASNQGLSGVWIPEFWIVPFTGAAAYLLKHPIAVREMAAVAVSCINWGPRWRGHHCLFECDNQGDVESFRKWRNDNPAALHFMRVIALAAALHCFTFDIKWICSKENKTADLATRVSLETFRSRCSNLSQFVNVSLPPRPTDPHWEDAMCREAAARNQSQLPPPLYPLSIQDHA